MKSILIIWLDIIKRRERDIDMVSSVTCLRIARMGNSIGRKHVVMRVDRRNPYHSPEGNEPEIIGENDSDETAELLRDVMQVLATMVPGKENDLYIVQRV